MATITFLSLLIISLFGIFKVIEYYFDRLEKKNDKQREIMSELKDLFYEIKILINSLKK